MNYRHIYHAGNFADVFKHIFLCLNIDYLSQKDKSFIILDTHAGTGLYDLNSPQAQKTTEWQMGIAQLLKANLIMPELTTYQNLVRPLMTKCLYPGSPFLARSLLRTQPDIHDKLILCEKHPEDYVLLAKKFPDDGQTKTYLTDGYESLKTLLPPPIKRGLVLIDPPFEAKNEADLVNTGLKNALKRWPQAIYMIWYPIKDVKRVLQAQNYGLNYLTIEFLLKPDTDPFRLNGCGLMILNPPYLLAVAAEKLMPVLVKYLGNNLSSYRLNKG